MEEYQKYDMLDCGITAIGHKFSAAEYGTGDHISIRFTAVRAGISWASDKSPFHMVVVGRQYIDENLYAITTPAYELLFECADHGLDLEARQNKMADTADLYKCDFYADLSGINEVPAESYRDFKSKHNFEHGSLLEAPYAGNLRLGVESIKSYVKSHSLDIPKDSPAFDQLSRITEADLAEPDVRQKFFAVESLRHVMAAYKRDPVTRRITFGPGPQYGSNEQGWMA
jgi:hypothetical protein